MSGWFKPLGSKTTHRSIVAFDLEGRGGPGGFLVGAISGGISCSVHHDRQALWEELLDLGSRGAWLFSHGLEYDLPIVAGPHLLDGQLLYHGQGILWATYQHRGRRVRFYDSANLFPRWTVEDLGKLVGRPKLEPPRGFVEWASRSLRWSDLDLEQQRQVDRYCLRDAEIVQAALEALQEELLRLGGQLSGTIAGCAMDLFRRRFHRWPWRALGPETNKIARPAFYGGRVENFAFGRVEGVSLYDRNSLYPAIQAEIRFPHPNKLQLVTDGDLPALVDRWEGVASAEVEVPELYVPPLPYRLQDKLYFPFGTLAGCWPLSELRAAAARGVAIRRIGWVLGSATTFNPFHDFVETLYRERMAKLGREDPLHHLVKLILNSLYGRFGLDPASGLWVLRPLPPDLATGDWRGWRTVELAGQDALYGPQTALQQPAYVNVVFAALISAGARLSLLEELERQDDSAVYCDTDSILTAGRIQTGDGLGAWRCQAEGVAADLLGPKEYVLHNRALGDQYVVKGVPEALARQYLTSGTARFRRAVKVREAIASHRAPSEWVETVREHQPTLPKREPAGSPFLGRDVARLSLPWHVEELRRWSQDVSKWRSRKENLRKLPRQAGWLVDPTTGALVPALFQRTDD